MRIGTVLGSAAPAEAHTLHGFFTMVNVLPGSAAGLEYVGEQIDRHLPAQANPA